jgi:GSCFA family/Tetratricopeptide repeat
MTQSAADLMAAGKALLLSSNGKMSAVVESERCFRRVLAVTQDNAEAFAYLGWSLDTQGRWSEAMPLFEKALELDPNQEVAILRRAVGIEELDLFELPDETWAPTYSRFPATIVELQDLEKTVCEHVLSHTPREAISLSKASNIVTIGSCFASNLANALSVEGFKVKNLPIGETINSTYANLELMRWAFGAEPNVSSEMPYNRDELNSFIITADIIIYTLGVAPCFFEKDGGKFVLVSKTEAVRGVLRGKYIFRNTTVDENTANLKQIISLIRAKNHDCKFVFSLSPVPLMATMEHRSSIEADCLSKSTLRVAADQIVSTTPGCIYWPSFEIVRWLGAYIPGMYGAEDGTPHHVSESIVQMIMGLFSKFYLRDRD